MSRKPTSRKDTSERDDEIANRAARDERVRQNAKAVKSRTTQHETSWQHPLTGKTHQLAIRHTQNYLGLGEDHVEIESPMQGRKREPNPLSDTCYRSHFLKAAELAAVGGPVAFIDRMLAEAVRDKKWLAAEARRSQGDLFQWADAQAETARRTTKAAAPAKRATRPTRTRRPAVAGDKPRGPK